MSEGPAALIVGAAPIEGHEAFYSARIRAAELVIAADGGCTLCRLSGRVPDVCIGDFDSVPEEDLTWAEAHGARIARFPAAKNESDLDLAVREARSIGVRTLDLTAAFAGRLDHSLASLGTLLSVADLRARGLEWNVTLYPLNADSQDAITLCEASGTLFSVYAIPGPATVSIVGARYELASAHIEPLSSLGLSNVVAGRDVTVTVEQGSALVLVSREHGAPRS